MGKAIDNFIEETWKVYQKIVRSDKKHREFDLRQECENLFSLLQNTMPEREDKFTLYDLYDFLDKLPRDFSQFPGFSVFEKEIISHGFVDPAAYEKFRHNELAEPSNSMYGGIKVQVGTRKCILYNAVSDYSKFKIMLNYYVLGEPHPFIFHFRLGPLSSFVNFPPGYQIGSGRLYSFTSLHPSIRLGMDNSKMRLVHVPSEEKKAGSGVIDITDSPLAALLADRYEDEMFMRIEITSAVGKKKAAQTSARQVTRSSSILKLFYVVPEEGFFGTNVEKFLFPTMQASPFDCYDAHECEAPEEEETISGFKFDGGWEWARHPVLSQQRFIRDSTLDSIISSLNQIIIKDEGRLAEIEKNIINAIDVFGLINDSTPLHIRLMLCVIALEGLLIKDKQENIRLKLAEKVALLVGDSNHWLAMYVENMSKEKDGQQQTSSLTTDQIIEARIELSRLMAKIYDKRSGFAHSGFDSKRSVLFDDYKMAYSVLRWVMQKLIVLFNNGQGILFIGRDVHAPEKSLDTYFERLKYGH